MIGIDAWDMDDRHSGEIRREMEERIAEDIRMKDEFARREAEQEREAFAADPF